MDDLISRQAAINAIENTDCELSADAWDELTDAIMQLPSAQPERCEDCVNFSKTRLLIPQSERKKGKWEFVGLQMFVCSECKHGFRQDWLMDWRTHNSEPIFPNFCPNCGAKMERRSE